VRKSKQKPVKIARDAGISWSFFGTLIAPVATRVISADKSPPSVNMPVHRKK